MLCLLYKSNRKETLRRGRESINAARNKYRQNVACPVSRQMH